MSTIANCRMTEAQVQQAFIAAPPKLAESLLTLNVQHGSWLWDLIKKTPWPDGSGTELKQFILRGQMPQIERGWDQWKKWNNNTGCDPCEGPDCAYNITPLGGNGIQEKVAAVMSRELKSPPYCVRQIQSTYQWSQVFGQIVQNMYAQIRFFKEQNIALNAFTMLAKKYVVDSVGIKPNTANPYMYPNVGTTVLSQLNLQMLQNFYEYMRMSPTAIPYDMVNGQPVFALACSPELLSYLYRDNTELRQDVRFSGLANDLVVKYNFITTIRGMFMTAPILTPRRFRIVAGLPVEVLPYVNNVPADAGAYTDINPNYINPGYATHEEVLLHGADPFELFYVPTLSSLGEGTDFGPEVSMFETFQWINPQTPEDPLRRVGYYLTEGAIGISQQYSDSIFGILVPRKPMSLTPTFWPAAECPPEAVNCDNEIPSMLCPCPLITSAVYNAVDENWIITFAVPVDITAGQQMQLGIDTGGYLVATVVAVSTDGLAITATFEDGVLEPGVCDHFTTIFCDNTMGCSATILSYQPNCSDATRVDLYLSNPVKGDVGETLTLTFGNGDTADVTIISIDYAQNKYVVDVGGTDFCDQVQGIVLVCVPTATDASCPGCAGPSYTQCET